MLDRIELTPLQPEQVPIDGVKLVRRRVVFFAGRYDTTTPIFHRHLLAVSKRSEQRNFIQLGSKPVLQEPANSRRGTKSEKVMRF